MELDDQIRTFHEFFQEEYYDELLERVRTGKKFLVVDFPKLAQYNPDLASLLLEQPDEVNKAAEMSLKNFDLKFTEEFFIRFRELPMLQQFMIRDVRAAHIGKFLQMDGIVRQKSDVRPQVTAARFECPSCGNILPVLQLDQKFKEPSRCGCGRKGKFRLLSKTLVDAQMIVLEESPEELEGGEQPKRLNVFLKNDLVAPMTDKQTNPGAKIRVTGVIKEVPILLSQGGQSVRYDLMCDVNFVEPMQEDYTQINISEEEERKILDLAADPAVFAKLTESLAPSIYGLEKVKEALILQLLGGNMKTRDEGGSKSRGDIHILLVGDPGAGKCITGDTLIQLADGAIEPIGELFHKWCGNPLSHENAYSTTGKISILSLDIDGKTTKTSVPVLWRRTAERLLRIKLRSGDHLDVTREHPFFTTKHGLISSIPAKDLKPGTPIACPRTLSPETSYQTLPTHRQSLANNAIHIKTPPILNERIGRLLGYLTGDGWLEKPCTRKPLASMVSLTNNDEEVLTDFETILREEFGTPSMRRHSHPGKSAQEVYTTSTELYSLISCAAPELVHGAGEKSVPAIIMRSPESVVGAFLKGYFECDAHVSPRVRSIELMTKSPRLAREVRLLLLRFGILSQLREKWKCATNSEKKEKRQYWEVAVSGEDAARFADTIGLVSTRKRRALQTPRTIFNTNKDVLPGLSTLLKVIRAKHGKLIKEMNIPGGSYRHYEKGDRAPSREQMQNILSSYAGTDDPLIRVADKFLNADIFWDAVESVGEIESNNISVYDIEASATHNFVANAAYIHNSQLLKRISYVAPKARFVSGKGASGAGLTAAVVRDEFLKGWALEAGALVLANRGIACIDELDKMSPEDRSAMHEALEQQTVTISKANIQATLRAETTVLAAANPKFGRFDPFELLAKQIDLPPTLMNRFDLIFPIRDLPDREKDEELASFILKIHQSDKVVAGTLDANFMRKYISYAKQRCRPKLTAEALEEIKAYYIKMRGSGGSEETIKAIPISARQLEALVRLTEASAKVRLSQEATKRDAKVAIDLVHHCLSAIGLDPTTGKFDIDRIATGVTAAQRSTIAVIKEIVADLEGAVGKVIPMENIIREAEIKGITEELVEETIEKLRRSGDLFSPKNGFISRM